MVMGAHRSGRRGVREGGGGEEDDSSLCATAVHLLTHIQSILMCVTQVINVVHSLLSPSFQPSLLVCCCSLTSLPILPHVSQTNQVLFMLYISFGVKLDCL